MNFTDQKCQTNVFLQNFAEVFEILIFQREDLSTVVVDHNFTNLLLCLVCIYINKINK